MDFVVSHSRVCVSTGKGIVTRGSTVHLSIAYAAYYCEATEPCTTQHACTGRGRRGYPRGAVNRCRIVRTRQRPFPMILETVGKPAPLYVMFESPPPGRNLPTNPIWPPVCGCEAVLVDDGSNFPTRASYYGTMTLASEEAQASAGQRGRGGRLGYLYREPASSRPNRPRPLPQPYSTQSTCAKTEGLNA